MNTELGEEWYSIAEILQDHEWEWDTGEFPVGFCRGQGCKWRGTQFEWSFHVGKLIKDWWESYDTEHDS